MPEVDYHAPTHRPAFLGGTDELYPYGLYEIKVFADRDALDGTLPDEAIVVSTGDSKFVFWIPQDLDGTSLVYCAAGVSVSGAVTVQIRNATQTYDFLTTPITVDSGEYFSFPASTTEPVIDDPHPVVETGDRICIDVDAADGTAEGLGVMLAFSIL